MTAKLLDIGAVMRANLERLREGVGGVECEDLCAECEDLCAECEDLCAECEDAWSRDYAIVRDAAPSEWDRGNYFDHDAWWGDFQRVVLAIFTTKGHPPAVWIHASLKVVVASVANLAPPDVRYVTPGTITIQRHRGANEIEVVRRRLPATAKANRADYERAILAAAKKKARRG